MQENNYCVYKHTSPSNKIYIGITSKKPEHRWNNGKSYLGNKHFANAIQKYGWDNFKHEILFENLTKEEACQKEIELIAFYKSNQPEFGYNHTIGGDGVKGIEAWNKGKVGVQTAWNKGMKMPEDFCKKVSESKMGKTRKGKPHSEKTKKKISEKGKGRKLSKEARKNISEGHKGLPTWNKGMVWWTKEGISKMAFDCPGEGWVRGRNKNWNKEKAQ